MPFIITSVQEQLKYMDNGGIFSSGDKVMHKLYRHSVHAYNLQCSHIRTVSLFKGTSNESWTNSLNKALSLPCFLVLVIHKIINFFFAFYTTTMCSCD